MEAGFVASSSVDASAGSSRHSLHECVGFFSCFPQFHAVVSFFESGRRRRDG